LSGVGAAPRGIASGYFNGDTRPDLVVANSDYNNSSLSVLLNTGSAAFSTKTDYATDHSPASIAVADLNGDGYLDLAAADRDSHTISLHYGIDNGKFGPKQDVAAGGGPWIAATDLDSDGLLDLAVATDGMLSFHRNTGAGFAPPLTYESALFTNRLVSADFDLDGRPDLATAHYQGLVAVHRTLCW
jgi:hypothetical protein